MHSYSLELRNNSRSVTQRVSPTERAGRCTLAARLCLCWAPKHAEARGETPAEPGPALPVPRSGSPFGLRQQRPAERGRGRDLPVARWSRGDAAFDTIWHSHCMGMRMNRYRPRSVHCWSREVRKPGAEFCPVPLRRDAWACMPTEHHGARKPHSGHRSRLPDPRARKARGS